MTATASTAPAIVSIVLMPTMKPATAPAETAAPVAGPKPAVSMPTEAAAEAGARGGGAGGRRPPAALGEHDEQDRGRAAGEVEGGQEAAERRGAQRPRAELPGQDRARIRAWARQRRAAPADAGERVAQPRRRGGGGRPPGAPHPPPPPRQGPRAPA